MGGLNHWTVAGWGQKVRQVPVVLNRGMLVVCTLILGASTASMRGPVLEPGEQGRVVSVWDGDSLSLDSGLKVRLSGIYAPALKQGRKTALIDPMGAEAKAALIALTREQDIRLYYGGEKRDRYDRALAHVFTLLPSGAPDLWVQEEMLLRGMARVYTWPDSYQDIARLYAAEQQARSAGRGLWNDVFYAIRSPDPNTLAQDVDSVQIVEGVITSSAEIRGRIYLNFGADYKTDFTIAIAKKNRKRFKKAGLDPLTLTGAKVRVRGWIELMNGPMIWLDHPDRLEVLD